MYQAGDVIETAPGGPGSGRRCLARAPVYHTAMRFEIIVK